MSNMRSRNMRNGTKVLAPTASEFDSFESAAKLVERVAPLLSIQTGKSNVTLNFKKAQADQIKQIRFGKTEDESGVPAYIVTFYSKTFCRVVEVESIVVDKTSKLAATVFARLGASSSDEQVKRMEDDES